MSRVAIVHYWIVGDAGGEKVVKAICELFPGADIFTLVHDPDVSAQLYPGHRVISSFIQKIPKASKIYTKLLPLMPSALEGLDLSGYDLVISSESGPAKGVITPADSVHVCYCHTPMRYLWDQFAAYMATSGLLTRFSMMLFGPWLRTWDVSTSTRVDLFVANSNYVKERIWRFYRRDATVIAPPIDVHDFAPVEAPEDFYFIAGRHVAYKRIELAIRMANATGRRLVVSGVGPETAALKKLAGSTVEFVGQVSFAELKSLYARCAAFLMPGEEDFGITPVEAMACGRPVIAYDRGGVRDTVIDGTTGVLFSEQSVEGLIQAIDRFERDRALFKPDAIAQHAQQFSRARFLNDFKRAVDEAVARRGGAKAIA